MKNDLLVDDALFQDAVEKLKASLCPSKYRYTHEFLAMAAAAASCESGTTEVSNNLNPGYDLAKSWTVN